MQNTDEYAEVKTNYINFAYYIEEIILKYLNKGTVYEVEVHIVDQHGIHHDRKVRIYSIDEQGAKERAKLLAQKIDLSEGGDSPLGIFFPRGDDGPKKDNERKGISGFVGRYANKAKNKARKATFQEGVPRPLALTKAHVESMLNNNTYPTIDPDTLDSCNLNKYAKRCLVIAVMWVGCLVTGIAILFAGLHPKNIESALLGVINPYSVFGIIAIITATLSILHSYYSRLNAIRLLCKRRES